MYGGAKLELCLKVTVNLKLSVLNFYMVLINTGILA